MPNLIKLSDAEWQVIYSLLTDVTHP